MNTNMTSRVEDTLEEALKNMTPEDLLKYCCDFINKKQAEPTGRAAALEALNKKYYDTVDRSIEEGMLEYIISVAENMPNWGEKEITEFESLVKTNHDFIVEMAGGKDPMKVFDEALAKALKNLDEEIDKNRDKTIVPEDCGYCCDTSKPSYTATKKEDKKTFEQALKELFDIV